jgi:hypothetical protein
MNIKEAIAHKDVFRGAIRDPSTFTAWQAFLSALFALPMSEQEAELFRACTGRTNLPTTPSSEAWLCCGRRSGKSFMMALVAVYLAVFKDYSEYLGIGERATVMVVAADRKQARVVMRYVRGLLRLPVFAKLVDKEATESFDLTNRVTIEVHTASIKSVRGYTIVAALCDEIAFWPQEESCAPDFEILDSIRPAMSTIPGAMMLCASSPYARRGALWDAYKRYHGRDDAPVLVWQAETRVMNPTVSQRIIDDATERDPASASAEYFARFRSDVEGFLTREIVDACTVSGRYELPRLHGVVYHGFCDPSGGAADEMTLCVAHREKEIAIIDCIRAVRPPFSPDSVCNEFADVLKSYGLHSVSGDRYAGEWPRERFSAHGISYKTAEKPKSDLYLNALPLFSSRRVEIPDHPKLHAQLVGLERKTARSGKDSIDHAPKSHDDLANAVCGAIGLAIGKKRIVITQEHLEAARKQGPYRGLGGYRTAPMKAFI